MEDDGQATDIYRKFLLGDAVGRLQFGNHVSRTAKKPGFCLLFLMGEGGVLILCIGLQVAMSREVSETAIAKLLDT